MKAQWLVAKYMPDLRRREPINIGVVLRCDGKIISRFQGQRDDGSINGTAVKGWAKDLQNYKSWIASWRYSFSKSWDLAKFTRRAADQSYFLEFSGERLLSDGPTEPSALLDQLYAVLVESVPDEVVNVKQLSDRIFRRLNIHDRLVKDFKFAIPVEDGDSLFDEVFFDYKFDHSAVNLFQTIALSFSDARTWDAVHAAAWSFAKASEYSRSKDESHRIVALVKPRDRIDRDLESQLCLLKKHAEVVNVSDEDAATSKLACLLHV